jgi:prepilin-type N-terminal cleavage/methylation domain-containing protein
VLTQSSRRGFTLLEIMVSLCMMLIVSGAVYQLLITSQRLSRAQSEQASLQANVRAGSLFVANELRELNTAAGGSSDRNDLLSISGSAATFRVMRGIGFLCQNPSATQIRIARGGFTGHREPQADRDSAYVFVEGDAATGLDDAWLPLPITQVSPGVPCPGGGPSIALTVPSTALLADVPAGTPVRIYEIMELKLYRSEGRSWLGARSVSAGEAIQPVVGPLTDGNGFRLEYLDGGGSATRDVAAVKSIRVTLRGISEGLVRAGGGQPKPVEEELSTQVSLRNASRP